MVIGKKKSFYKFPRTLFDIPKYCNKNACEFWLNLKQITFCSWASTTKDDSAKIFFQVPCQLFWYYSAKFLHSFGNWICMLLCLQNYCHRDSCLFLKCLHPFGNQIHMYILSQNYCRRDYCQFPKQKGKIKQAKPAETIKMWKVSTISQKLLQKYLVPLFQLNFMCL